MRIGMVAFGSDGDIQPFIELATALAKRQHSVEMFVASIRNRDYSAINSIDGITLSQKEFPVATMNEEFDDTEFWNFDNTQFYLFFDRQYKLVRKHFRRYAKKLTKSCDLVIGDRQSYPLRFSAEADNVPYVSLNFDYTLIKSGFYPPLTIASGTPQENNKSWEEAGQHANQIYLPELNEYRKLYKLPPIADYYNKVAFSDQLNIVSFSRHLLYDNIDWEPQHHLCGYFNSADKNSDWNAPDDLVMFVDQGTSIICITLGSLSEYEDDLDAMYTMLEVAVKQAKCRAIILSNEPNDKISDDQIYYLDGFVNYNKVFPMCDLIIYHGGVGTMHDACTAGVPSLILAYGFDQFRNAELLVNRGVCKSVLSRKGILSSELSENIISSLGDRELTGKAKELGQKMRDENGLHEAVRVIEERYSVVHSYS